MLTLNISTEVDGNFRAVFQGFSRDLFLRLNPPLPPVKLLRFDGMGVGDEVHLELSFIFFRQRWISRITAFEESENEIFFVDEGIQLPFFLQSWRHCHRIVDRQGQATIIDEITFQAPNRLLSLLLLPTLYLQFLYRKPIYKCFFPISKRRVDIPHTKPLSASRKEGVGTHVSAAPVSLRAYTPSSIRTWKCR